MTHRPIQNPNPIQVLIKCTSIPGDAMPDHLPGVVRSDKHAIALVKGGEKSVMTVADVMCDITKTKGITEVHVADHDMAPCQKDWYSKKRFRLNV